MPVWNSDQSAGGAPVTGRVTSCMEPAGSAASAQVRSRSRAEQVRRAAAPARTTLLLARLPAARARHRASLAPHRGEQRAGYRARRAAPPATVPPPPPPPPPLTAASHPLPPCPLPQPRQHEQGQLQGGAHLRPQAAVPRVFGARGRALHGGAQVRGRGGAGVVLAARNRPWQLGWRRPSRRPALRTAGQRALCMPGRSATRHPGGVEAGQRRRCAAWRGLPRRPAAVAHCCQRCAPCPRAQLARSSRCHPPPAPSSPTVRAQPAHCLPCALRLGATHLPATPTAPTALPALP